MTETVRITLRLPQSVHEALERSKPLGVSLNQEIVDRLAASLGEALVPKDEANPSSDFVSGQKLSVLEAELEDLRAEVRQHASRLKIIEAARNRDGELNV